MLNEEAVIFEETVNGEQVSVTFGQLCQNAEVLQAILYGGVKRAVNSAATNKADDESADHAKLRRVRQIQMGEMWSRGGGHSLSEAERARRDILAAYATTYANLKRTAAEEKARKDTEGLLTETAEAIIKRNDGKKPGKERLQNGVEKLRQMVESEVQKRLEAAQTEISI